MSRSNFDLDRMVVASPCPVAWDDMASDGCKRFCNQCNLNGYNISAMTRSEAESFIERTEREITTRTNDIGRFRFTDVEPGGYTIHVGSPGFVSLRFSELKFEEEVALNLNVKLSVGALEMLGVIVTPDAVPTIDKFEWVELKRKERPRN